MGVKSQLLGIFAMVLCGVIPCFADSSSTNTEHLSSTHYTLSEDEVSGNRERDSLVLIDFYEQSNGDNWSLRWNLTMPMNFWAGVTLDNTGCVTCLDLDGSGGCTISEGASGNNLTGIITPRINELTNLEHLILGNNRLTGNIPEEVFELPRLKTFDIYGNGIIGPLPATIEKADSLVTLSLAGNQLEGTLPEGISKLKFLENIDLEGNNIIGPLPSSLRDLDQLKRLRLNNNRINGIIPENIGEMQQLEALILSDNLFTGNIPSSIGNMASLQQLDLSNNELDGNIPPELTQATALKELKLSKNALSGGIPENIGNLTALEIFDVSRNAIIGPLPASTTELKALKELNISYNTIIGPLPSLLSELKSIEVINAERNSIIGPLPLKLNELSELRDLNLSGNDIDGQLPEDIGNLPKLDSLDLSNNKLQGCFPTSLEDKCDKAYFFDNNSEMPWQGDITQFCQGLTQEGADCSTNTGATEPEYIHDDCSCATRCGTTIPEEVIQTICIGEELVINGTVYNEENLEGTEQLMTVSGCDSIINVSLELIALQEAQDDVFNSVNTNIYDVLLNDDISDIENYRIEVIETDNVDNAYIDDSLKLVVEVEDGFIGLSTISYEICDLDCDAQCSVATVSIETKGDGYDMDVMTPNNDGIKDALVIPGYNENEVIDDSFLKIMNRWGQVIYSVHDYANDWKGTSAGQSLPEGVYYYQLTIGITTHRTGSRSIIR